MSKKGQDIQVEMDWALSTTKHNGRYYVTLNDKRLGAGLLTQEAADAVMKWQHTSLNDICDLISDGLEEYFRELEKP